MSQKQLNRFHVLSMVIDKKMTNSEAAEVKDSMGDPITDATASINPAATIKYLDENGEPDPGLTSTSSAGFVLITDVSPGNYTLSISHNDHTFEPSFYNADVEADILYYTQFRASEN